MVLGPYKVTSRLPSCELRNVCWLNIAFAMRSRIVTRAAIGKRRKTDGMNRMSRRHPVMLYILEIGLASRLCCYDPSIYVSCQGGKRLGEGRIAPVDEEKAGNLLLAVILAGRVSGGERAV